MFRAIFAKNSDLSLSDYADLASVPRHRTFKDHEIVQLFRKAVPFDFIAVVGMDFDDYAIGNGHSVDTDLPPAFLETYYSENWVQNDPFVQATRGAEEVIIEEDVYKTNPPEQRLSYIFRTFGISNRTLFPLRRDDKVYGAVTFCRSEKFTHLEMAFLSMIAPVLHDAFVRPIVERFGAEHLKLTKGELAALQGASRGSTSEAISAETGFSAQTVDTYIKSATKKLGAKNRTQAVADAIRRNLIS